MTPLRGIPVQTLPEPPTPGGHPLPDPQASASQQGQMKPARILRSSTQTRNKAKKITDIEEGGKNG